MKTTDSVMREKYRKIGAEIIRIAHKFGINEIDLAGELGTLSQLNKDLNSHSLAEARREVDERCERAEKLLDDVVIMFGKQNSDLHIIQEVRDLMALRIKEGKSVTATWRRELDLLTGDNQSK